MRLLSITICLIFLTSCSMIDSFSRTASAPESANEQTPDITTSHHVVEPEAVAKTSEQKTKTDEVIQETTSLPVEKPLTKLAPSQDPITSKFEQERADPRPLLPSIPEPSLSSESITVLTFPYESNEDKEQTPKKGADFSAYGFFTPDDELEKLINTELESLRTNKDAAHGPDLLDRIRRNFQLDLSLENRRITSQRAWYVRNPNYLTRTFNRASRYLYHVVNEVEKRDLPMELALLPFVESAYNPFAYSHGRASGLWQFIPGTGKIYGLEQDWWYDGRRDVLASTEAAINYLTYLHSIFDGNWLHALAAYNSGSGRVRSAIRKNQKRNKPTDFWSLDLPRETRAYVPKLLALSQIVQNPSRYEVEFPFIANAPYFEKVEIGAQIDLAQAAQLAEVDISEIYQLNPGFNQWASSPLGPHRLLVPIEKAERFQDNLRAFPPENRIHWQRYSVRSGDSLIKIAKKFNTSPALIKDINHLRSNTIKIKQKLLIPTASKDAHYYDLSQHNRLLKKQDNIQAKKQTDKLIYRVKPGDTFWDLAREHKVSVRELSRWNGMAPTDPLKSGQQLTIWSKNASLSTAQPSIKLQYKKREMIQKVGYYVRKGDSLARIASKFSVTINDLVTWNKLDKRKYLKPGQKLTIYVDITNG